MPSEQPRALTPSVGFPLREFPTPNLADGIWQERISLRQNYSAIPRGTLYATTEKANADIVAAFPLLYFLREDRVQGSDEWAIRTWATERNAEDTFNAEISYLVENVSYPIFVRSYTIRRDVYEATPTIATGTPLKVITAINVTAAGTGYTSATATSSNGATLSVILNGSGGIASVVVLKQGTDVTSAPTITIAGTGTGATALALIQSQSATLVSQKKVELPEDDPMRNDFVRVIRAYKILPGPALTGATQNSNGAAGTLVTQDVAYGASADTGADVLESEVAPTSSVEAKKTTRTGALWSNTTGLVRGKFGIPGTISEAEVAKGSAAIQAGRDIESSTSEPQDAARNHERTISVPYSTTTITFNDVDERGDAPAVAITFPLPGSTPPTESEVIRVKRELDTLDRLTQRVETVSGSRSALVTKQFDEFGGLEVATQTIESPATVPTNVDANIQQLRQTRKKEAELLSVVMATGSVVDEIVKVDKDVPGSRATIEYYLVLASSSIPADTSTITYERKRHPKNAKLRIEIKTTYAIPSTFSDEEDMSFPFPSLFSSFYSDDLQGTTRNSRQGFSANVPHRVEHSFGVTRIVPAPLQIIEADLLIFSFSVRGLMDATSVYRTNNGVLYTQSVSATSPSKTAYLALVGGAEQLVGGKSRIWNAGIYHTEKYYLVME